MIRVYLKEKTGHQSADSKYLFKMNFNTSAYFRYYFDGQGKAVRPVIAMTVGHAFNVHCGVPEDSEVFMKQRKVSIISEMIHTASLLHDDVLDK